MNINYLTLTYLHCKNINYLTLIVWILITSPSLTLICMNINYLTLTHPPSPSKIPYITTASTTGTLYLPKPDKNFWLY
jgi:hypothetical protein